MMRNLTLATALLGVLALPAFAEGDPAKGEKVFNKCKACHAVGEDAKNRVGPVLNGVIGATAAQVEGYKYSKAMAEKGEEGMVWDEPTLTAYLTKPREVVPGTKMSFAGLRKESEIMDVLAYLAQY